MQLKFSDSLLCALFQIWINFYGTSSGDYRILYQIGKLASKETWLDSGGCRKGEVALHEPLMHIAL